MSGKLSARELEGLIHALVVVHESNLGFEIELPLVYPTGDTVTVTVAPEVDSFVVHDSGTATALLSAGGVTLTSRLSGKFSELAIHYGCELINGRVIKRCLKADLPVVVAIVANASRAVGDYLLSAPHQPILDFKTEALDLLRETIGDDRIRKNENILGSSGSQYVASAIILSRDQQKYVGIVEPIRDRDAATKKFREFWDISQSSSLSRVERIAVYDDRREWHASDLNLLQNVSNLVRLTDSKTRMKEFA